MGNFATVAGVLTLVSLSLLHGAAPAAAVSGASYRVVPNRGVTLAVGGKRAVGYYTASGDACNLTLVLAEPYSDASPRPSEPVRVNMAVREGTSTHIDTLGKTLVFTCERKAAAMTIEPIERLAYHVTR